MLFYFAPMEGLTDSVYRRLHHTYFPGIDFYFMPFFSPTTEDSLSPREARELAPEPGVPAIPQVLTKDPQAFLRAAKILADFGYPQINLNLGCPSGTVVAKGKGSGMLRDLDSLSRFLDTIFSETPLPISIKTRIGMEGTEEWPELLSLFNRYPVEQLIVHPRLRREFYKGSVHMDAFELAYRESRNSLCYNGDLTSRAQIQAFSSAHPDISALMLGRGLIGNPGMLCPGGTGEKNLEQFHNELLENYLVTFGGSRNAMFRMKEHWRYLLCLFDGSEKLGKQLRKTTDLAQFRNITAQIFHTLPMRSNLNPDW